MLDRIHVKLHVACTVSDAQLNINFNKLCSVANPPYVWIHIITPTTKEIWVTLKLVFLGK